MKNIFETPFFATHAKKKFCTLLPLIFLFALLSPPPSFSQEQKDTTVYTTQTIEVNALKGLERITPIAFEDVKRETIEKTYWMQDFPMFINGKTSINSYSESGASIGYSYFSLRGFDQKRISILINGTPQNDPEDHQVYWVDLSDIASSVENIQIQRGIGTSLYGASSIGGVINIQTIDFFKRRFLNLYSGFGNYNSNRFSFEYSSGMLGDGYGVYGKFTKTKSDGYRNLSWSDHWSYFLSAGKILGKNAVVKFNTYGGPIKNHLAYIGITRNYLDGKITGNQRNDRKFNPLTFPNESDNYNQPHYELIFNIQPVKNLFVSNTLNYIRGDGYFITNFPVSYGYNLTDFRLNPFYTSDSTTFNSSYYQRDSIGRIQFFPGKGYQIVRSDIVAKLYVNNDTYGWFPKIQLKHSKEKGTLVIGGELKFHRSEHYGEISFGNALPPETPPDFRYYFYNGKKRTFSVYANEIFNVTKKLSVMAGVQYVNHKYTIENDKFKPYAFSVDYSFFTPRAGVNYIFNDYLRAFVNVSMAKREPRLKDIYDAEGLKTKPNFRIVDPANNRYEDPLVSPEEMLDYEAGVSFTSKFLKADLNFYWMNFKNEIVNNGQLDNVGQPINGNAGKSVHRGIEIEFDLHPFANLKNKFISPISFNGNLNLSQNFFKEYREKLGVDNNGNIIYGNDYSDNRILLSPEIIGNLSMNYNSDFGIGFYISLQHIGRQYLDNTENERKTPSNRNVPGYVDKLIDAYTVFNAGVSVDLIPLINNPKLSNYIRKFETRLRINNLFDKLYEFTGNIDWNGAPNWLPAAERNIFIDLSVGF